MTLCTVDDGVLNVLNIAAFDHDFQDNAGVYEVVFSVTRQP